MEHPLDQVVHQWVGHPPRAGSTASFSLADVRLTVETDDPSLLDALATVLGSSEPPPRSPFASFSASVRTHDAPAGFGHLRLDGAAERFLTPDDFLLGLASPEFPFELLDAPPPWLSVAFKGDSLPVFALRGADCLVRLMPQWQTAVALFLFQRLMRLREDAIFFHASSVDLRGAGAIFVGPKGSGKSTIALALAARGHGLLGDENACYLPAVGDLLPFRRPVGVKPGPRARAVTEALERIGRDADREGPMRLDSETLLPGPPPGPVPLRFVVFLDGFSPEPRLSRTEPGRRELGRMQPVGSSLINASSALRVFQMARLLAAARVYRLSPGAPDTTADLIEEVLGRA